MNIHSYLPVYTLLHFKYEKADMDILRAMIDRDFTFIFLRSKGMVAMSCCYARNTEGRKVGCVKVIKTTCNISSEEADLHSVVFGWI